MDLTAILHDFMILSTLTVGVTQVYKEVINDNCTQWISVCIATVLAFVTGTSLLTPLGFSSSQNFVSLIPGLHLVYSILFYLVDLLITGFLSSKGSNYLVELLKGSLPFQKADTP